MKNISCKKMPSITFNSYVIEFILFLQVSLDGPNVNLHFIEIVKEKRKDTNLKPLLNRGTYGLHTVHNAFKHGAKVSGWSN